MDECRPGLETDPAFGEFSNADLRSLEVGHDRHFAAQALRAFANAARVLAPMPCAYSIRIFRTKLLYWN